jgi:MOSC domain-containing protein YiiM
MRVVTLISISLLSLRAWAVEPNALAADLRMRTKVISLNVGKPKLMKSDVGDVVTSMNKTPIKGPLKVFFSRVVGNKQEDTFHTLYVLGRKQILPYMKAMGYDDYPPGFLGEQVLVDDLSEWTTYSGDKWRMGNLVLVADESRTPCYKLDIRFNQKGAATRMKLLRVGGVMFEPEAGGEIKLGDTLERFEIGDRGKPIIRPPR